MPTDGILWLWNSRENVPVLLFIHILKTVHLWQIKGMYSSKLGTWKGYHLSTEDTRMGYLFFQIEMVYNWEGELSVKSDRKSKLFTNIKNPNGSSLLSWIMSFYWNIEQFKKIWWVPIDRDKYWPFSTSTVNRVHSGGCTTSFANKYCNQVTVHLQGRETAKDQQELRCRVSCWKIRHLSSGEWGTPLFGLGGHVLLNRLWFSGYSVL